MAHCEPASTSSPHVLSLSVYEYLANIRNAHKSIITLSLFPSLLLLSFPSSSWFLIVVLVLVLVLFSYSKSIHLIIDLIVHLHHNTLCVMISRALVLLVLCS